MSGNYSDRAQQPLADFVNLLAVQLITSSSRVRLGSCGTMITTIPEPLSRYDKCGGCRTATP